MSLSPDQAVRALNPHRATMFLAIGAVVAIAAVVIGVAFWVLDRMESDAHALTSDGASLQAASLVTEGVKDIELHLGTNGFADLPAGSVERGEAIRAIDAEFAGMQSGLMALSAAYGVEAGQAINEAYGQLRLAFLSHLDNPTPTTREAVSVAGEGVVTALAGRDGASQLSAESRFQDLIGAIDTMRWVLVVATFGATPAIVGAVWMLGRRMGRMIAQLSAREHSLVESNALMERRNKQFFGLYQVVTEVTETLSLKYVVQTTVREARALVDADLVVLRVLDGERLRLAGMEPKAAQELNHIDDEIDLGQGSEGRAAKRGKILSLDAPVDRDGGIDGSPLAGARSALVVPLIVGARVVGTVSCWAVRGKAFSPDDIQVIEMMASQVATAIAAASLHEGSEHDAHHDALTSLPNRRQLAEDTRYEFDMAVRRGRRMAVAMVDIDHFKRFNDEYGHRTGDTALQRVARLLESEVREDDRVYRYGGEEFVIVFDRLTAAQAMDACERLRRLLNAEPLVEGAGTRVTASFGVAAAPEMGREFDELVQLADAALYQAKEGGRDRVQAHAVTGEVDAAA